MKRILLTAFVLVGLLSACVTAPPSDGGTTTTTLPQVTTTTLPQGPQEPASHEQPLKVTEEGLKVGGCYLVSESASTWAFSTGPDFSPAPPACTNIPTLGSSCDPNVHGGCKANNGTFSCARGTKQFKCFGWVYEKGFPISKPLAGAKLDVFWFAGCLAGMCGPQAGPVVTDEFGYYEIFTNTLLDSLRVTSPSGYYGHCHNGKPISGGGSYIADLSGAIGERKKFPAGSTEGVFFQHKLKADSCK